MLIGGHDLKLLLAPSLNFDGIALLVTKNNFDYVILWIPFHSVDHGHELLNGQLSMFIVNTLKLSAGKTNDYTRKTSVHYLNGEISECKFSRDF